MPENCALLYFALTYIKRDSTFFALTYIKEIAPFLRSFFLKKSRDDINEVEVRQFPPAG
jgi:hypothetical protein